MSVADYNTDPNSNTSISGINIAEGCPPSGINNAIRQMMADIKTADNANVKLSGNQTISGTKTFSSTIQTGASQTALNSKIPLGGTLRDPIQISDSSDVRVGIVRGEIDGDGDRHIGIFSVGSNNSIAGNLVAGIDKDGILYTKASATSSIRTNGTDIITRDYFNNNVVKLSGDQTVGGKKTFSTGIVVATNTAIKRDVDNNQLTIYGGSGYGKGAYLNLRGKDSSESTGQFFLRASDGTNNKDLIGKPDGTLTWNGQSIQTTSDERLKTPITDVPDAVLDAWGDVGWGQFQYLDAVEKKGADKARLHLGLIAQRVKTAFEARGLDACAYGILCHEEYPARDEEPAVDLWMVRYTEATAMEAAYQRRRADRAEARIADLERRLDALEAAFVAVGA